MGFEPRVLIICPGLIGWLGAWGYMAAWLWLPYAAWRSLRAARAGVALRASERMLLAFVPILIVVVQVLLRGTPLKHGYPLQ